MMSSRLSTGKSLFVHIFDTTSGVPGVILFRIAFSEPPQTTEELCTYVLKRNATAEP